MQSLDSILKAYEDKEFFLVYMPTIDLVNNTCVGCEALMRWDRKGDIIPPLEFIPMIENTVLSGLLTYHAIETIAEELADWLKTDEELHVGINIPPEILGRGAIEYAIRKSGMFDVINQIVLEITERGLPDHIGLSTFQKFTKYYKNLIAIDDFGTGDAHLTKLSDMTVDIIKIDKSFVDKITCAKDIPKIVRATVAFAHTMDVKIIAEGVESRVQEEALKSLGVDMAQGYHFAKPMKADEFLQFYHEHNEKAGKGSKAE